MNFNFYHFFLLGFLVLGAGGIAKADVISEYQANGIHIELEADLVDKNGSPIPAAASYLAFMEQNKEMFFARRKAIVWIDLNSDYSNLSLDSFSENALSLNVNLSPDVNNIQKLLTFSDRWISVTKTFGITIPVNLWIDRIPNYEEMLSYFEPKLQLLHNVVGRILIDDTRPGNGFSYEWHDQMSLRSLYLISDYKKAFESFLQTRANTIHLLNILENLGLRLRDQDGAVFRDRAGAVEELAKILIANESILAELKSIKANFDGIILNYSDSITLDRPMGTAFPGGSLRLMLGQDSKSILLLPQFLKTLLFLFRLEENLALGVVFPPDYTTTGDSLDERWLGACQRFQTIVTENPEKLRRVLHRYDGRHLIERISFRGEKTAIFDVSGEFRLSVGLNETIDELRQFVDSVDPH